MRLLLALVALLALSPPVIAQSAGDGETPNRLPPGSLEPRPGVTPSAPRTEGPVRLPPGSLEPRPIPAGSQSVTPGPTHGGVQVWPPQGSVAERRPVVRAVFPAHIRGGTASIWVDGRNLTGAPETGLNYRTLQWRATWDLEPGLHSAAVEAVGTDDRRYRREWSFYVE